MRIVFMLTLISCAAGCMTLSPEARIPLGVNELAKLKSHKDIVLTEDGGIKGCEQVISPEAGTDQYGFRIGSLRYRILTHSKSLQLNPAEIKILSERRSVTISGKSGNLKGIGEDAKSSSTGYAKGSLINRILGYKQILPKVKGKSADKNLNP